MNRFNFQKSASDVLASGVDSWTGRCSERQYLRDNVSMSNDGCPNPIPVVAQQVCEHACAVCLKDNPNESQENQHE